jgi:hypothetical protein
VKFSYTDPCSGNLLEIEIEYDQKAMSEEIGRAGKQYGGNVFQAAVDGFGDSITQGVDSCFSKMESIVREVWSQIRNDLRERYGEREFTEKEGRALDRSVHQEMKDKGITENLERAEALHAKAHANDKRLAEDIERSGDLHGMEEKRHQQEHGRE